MLLEKNKEISAQYEARLEKFYNNLKVRAPSFEESQNISPRKGLFKYHWEQKHNNLSWFLFHERFYFFLNYHEWMNE